MNMNKLTSRHLLISLLLTALSGCAVMPKQLDSQGQDDGTHFARTVVLLSEQNAMMSATEQLHSTDNNMNIGQRNDLFTQTFSRGDMLNIRIDGMQQFDGLYKIATNGTLELPFAPAFVATGLSRLTLINNIETELVRLKWFYQDSVKVDLSVVQLASVNISVTGAVFNPGRVTVNAQPANKAADIIQQSSGAFSSGRDLVAALSAAGGIRPDADLNQVYIKRGERIIRMPLNALINGDAFVELPQLINGDQILVRSNGVVNETLIRPSQITPPGMRVFMSNLTAPSLTNAQSAVGSDSTRLPYGSSLLDSAISANCIGGTHQANASRSVVLITRNFGSAEQIVVRRTINQLLANSSDHSVNPFVMPNDGLACYDSKFTNFRDVARGIGEVISPIILGGLL